MLVKVMTPMVDSLGRSFRAGDHRTLPDVEAESLIAAGYAQRVPPDAEHAVALLESLGGGLLVLPETDPELIEAAKEEGLRVAKLAQDPKAKAKK